MLLQVFDIANGDVASSIFNTPFSLKDYCRADLLFESAFAANGDTGAAVLLLGPMLINAIVLIKHERDLHSSAARAQAQRA